LGVALSPLCQAHERGLAHRPRDQPAGGSWGQPGAQRGMLLAADANEERLLQLLVDAPGPAHILVTAIGGQGHLFGRGNQQFSPAVIRAVGVDNVRIVAAKAKMTGLQGRPLLVDTNDVALDLALCGLRSVTTGYDDQVLYRVSTM
jgi:predicted polyphosphate/ATP-dependent NAD kinase